MAKETYEFKAETKELLDLMVNSIYTNKEIFLRELISNASDALDKLHFLSLTNRDILGGDENYEIYLALDKEKHTLTISDTGVGMTREELVENIGTIAKSGTKAFMEKLKEVKKEANTLPDKELIGQFGVGFYAAFMVASKVVIQTRKAGEKDAFLWESTGDGSFVIEEANKEKRGTNITLYLKEEFYDEKGDYNFLDEYSIEHLIKKYSDYVRYPIKMNFIVEEPVLDKEGKPVEGKDPIKKNEIRTLNSMQPLWTKNKNEIKPEEYNEFFKSEFHEWEEPLEVFHNKAEGNIEYTSLLFIPAKAPFNLYHTDFEAGIALYSRQVFIMEKCKDLLPDYLRFVKGLVDSPDLKLNISRELLQQSRELKLIGKNLEKTILKTLERLLKNYREKYEKFWQEFGKSLKIGIYNSMYKGMETIDRLKNLLIFQTSKGEKLITLKEYTEHMLPSQKKIYYATGKNRNIIEKLPQMEILKEKGIEVLYLLDNVDEFTIEALREYDGKSFHSISRGDLDLGDAESEEIKKETKDITAKNDTLIKDIKDILQDKISEVKISTRLKTSAVCLVASEEGPSIAMEQTFAQMDNNFFKAKRVLEINPHHALFTKLQSIHQQGKDSEDFKEYVNLLYSQALLIEGIMPENPIDFADKLARLMAK